MRETLGLSGKRAVIKTLMTITLHFPGRGAATRSARPRCKVAWRHPDEPCAGTVAAALLCMPPRRETWKMPKVSNKGSSVFLNSSRVMPASASSGRRAAGP